MTTDIRKALHEARIEIIFGDKKPSWAGGIAYYDDLTFEQLIRLMEIKAIDPEDNQNGSPSVEDFFKFMQVFTEFTAFGYVVDISRDDDRVSIEGITANDITGNALAEFMALCRSADELTVVAENASYVRAWWD